jgi:NAD(P)-dependent dehydrogenase (short-subunit alcohol dehydrogenase family)
VEDTGRRCVTVPGDVGDRVHCQALVDRAVEELGGLGVLVNDAAYRMAYLSFLEMPARRDRLCVPDQHDRRARNYYAATKGAISTFTKGLAERWDPRQRGRAGADLDAPWW